MEQLLRITTIPIRLDYKSVKASLDYKAHGPGLDLSRQKGGLDIERKASEVHMDSTEMRGSIGLKNAKQITDDFAAEGKRAALEAIRDFAEYGNKIVDTCGKGDPLIDMAVAKTLKPTQTTIRFLPETGPEITVQPGFLRLAYIMDQLSFDWRISKTEFNYLPYDLSFTVTQYPAVNIEYIGGSANSRYDLRA